MNMNGKLEKAFNHLDSAREILQSLDNTCTFHPQKIDSDFLGHSAEFRLEDIESACADLASAIESISMALRDKAGIK